MTTAAPRRKKATTPAPPPDAIPLVLAPRATEELRPHDYVATELLFSSGTNHRSEGDVDELAASIASNGILTPLLVRRSHDGFEIVDGHRRLIASRKAGLGNLPVIVIDASDAEAAQIALIANLQRADVAPLDEADAYRVLIEEHGLAVAEIAARLGRGERHIRRRLALKNLCGAGRWLLQHGLLSVLGAEELVRLADHEAQVKALESAVDSYMEIGAVIDDLRDGKQPKQRDVETALPIGVEDLRGAVRQGMLELARAPWDHADAELVPAAGSCTACPKRSSKDADLYGQVKDGDYCLDRACWLTKMAAHTSRVVEKARAENKRVLEPEESKKLFSGEFLTDASRVDLDKTSEIPGKRGPWRQVAKSVLGEIDTEVAIDAEGRAHELVDRKALSKALAKAGINGVPKAGRVRDPHDTEKSRQRAEKKKRDRQIAVHAFVLEEVLCAITILEPSVAAAALIDAIALGVARAARSEPVKLAMRRRDLDRRGLESLSSYASDAELVVSALIAQGAPGDANLLLGWTLELLVLEHWRWPERNLDGVLTRAALAVGVDVEGAYTRYDEHVQEQAAVKQASLANKVSAAKKLAKKKAKGAKVRKAARK